VLLEKRSRAPPENLIKGVAGELINIFSLRRASPPSATAVVGETRHDAAGKAATLLALCSSTAPLW
jgi:hypothetical protein